jgi:hypothetical protein
MTLSITTLSIKAKNGTQSMSDIQHNVSQYAGKNGTLSISDIQHHGYNGDKQPIDNSTFKSYCYAMCPIFYSVLLSVVMLSIVAPSDSP